MRIDAIIQAVRYADMLAITLPLNKAAFDSVTVWTAPGDEEVQRVCQDNGVTCRITDAFHREGDPFNRGRAYNTAFRRLITERMTQTGSPEGWVCQIDSDIVMLSGWREAFEKLPPDPECFYGARRHNVETAEQWAEVCGDDGDAALQRLTLFRGIGYGYLQLWNAASSTFIKAWNATQGNAHPEWSDGSTADWQWRNLWGSAPWDPPTQPPDHVLDHTVPEPCDPPTGLLRKLPFNVVHLGIPGVNATGRHTPLWTAITPPASQPS